MSDTTPIKSSEGDCLNMTRAITMMDMLKWTWAEEPSRSLIPTHKSTANYGMLRAVEIVFPREEHIIWLFSTKWSALKIYIQVTLYRLSGL